MIPVRGARPRIHDPLDASEDTEFDGGWGLLDPRPGQIQMSGSGSGVDGGWGGLRESLHRDGIDFTGLYMMESAGNPVGGDLHKLRYTMILDSPSIWIWANYSV